MALAVEASTPTAPTNQSQLAPADPELPLAIDLSQQRAAFNPSTLVVLGKTPMGKTLAQIIATPSGSFAVFNPNKTYQLDAQTALWLHFKVIGESGALNSDWVFDLPKSFVDRVEFYYRDTAGAWQMQVAGDFVPQSQWAVRGLHPQFFLPPLAAGQHDFYVKVNQLLPLRFDVHLKTAEQASFDNQNAFLSHGLLLGFGALVALVSLILAATYRSAIYSWYAVYVLLAFLAVASYVGVGHFALWPLATWWSEVSHSVLMLVALAVQLQFCRLMFVDSQATPWLNRIIMATTPIPLIVAVLVSIPNTDVSFRVYAVLFASVTAGIALLPLVLRAPFKRSMVSWLWLLAYLPVVAALTLTLIEEYGIAPVTWLPYNSIGFAIGLEVLILLVALQIHVKSAHALRVRKTTLADLDPLTGFLAAQHWPEKLTQMWGDARHRRSDLVVTYIRASLDDKSGASALAQTPSSNDIMLRCVRMLNTVARPDDVVARIGGNLFAILMPDVSAGPSLANKLSRLIALGAMTDFDDKAQLPIRFRIAATSFKSFSGTSSQLDHALQTKLIELASADEASIVFLRN